MTPKNPDQLFISSLQAGEESSYALLVERYHHALCVYAYNLTREKADAEDIVQNVFVRVWRKREKLNPALSIKSFLYRSVYNEFIDNYRKRKVITTVERDYFAAINDFVQEGENKDLERLVEIMKNEIENLPPKCKEVFLLSKKNGLTNDEISCFLDISIKTVEAHITKAFSILRKKIGARVEVLLIVLFCNGSFSTYCSTPIRYKKRDLQLTR